MNKFQFMGRLTRDPEERSTNTGTQVVSFSVAVNRRFADQNGQRQADFFNLTAFGKTGEFVSKYFKKGNQVLIEGRIQNRTWEDQNGQKKYYTDYIVEQSYFADSRRDSSSQGEMINSDIPSDDGEFITIEDSADLPF